MRNEMKSASGGKKQKEIQELKRKIEKLEREIGIIQKSTRTDLKFLSPLHHWFRAHFKFYYRWHLNPYAGKVHIGALILYTLAILIFSFNFLVPTKAAGNVYYVAKNGSDSNPGTEAQPWLTIQKAANTLVAGDTVYVKAGTYYETVTLPTSGTIDNPIKFIAYPGNKVVIDGENIRNYGFRVNQNYIHIEGLEVTKVNGHAILVNWDSNKGYGDEIRNCKIYNNGGGVDAAGIYYRFSRSGIIENNIINNNEGDGVTIPGVINGITIKNNTIHDNNVDGIKGGGLGSIIIEGNVIYNHISDVNHGDGIQYMGDEAIIRNNIIYENTQDIYIDTYSPTPGDRLLKEFHIYNNLVYVRNSGHKNGIVFDGRYNKVNGIYIFNNTIVDKNEGSGGIRFLGSYGANTLVIKNNIFQNSYLMKETPFSITNAAVDYNLYWINRTWNTWSIAWGSNYTTPSDFYKATGMEAHGKDGDALFIDQNNYNFHLQNTSPAVDAGTSDGAPTTDKDGNPRYDDLNTPNTGGGTYPYYDIGAYEYGSSGPDTTPPSVSFVRPSNNATVSGIVDISASVSDNVGISKVEFYLDNILKLSQTTPGGDGNYGFGWNSKEVSDGSHSLKVKGYDHSNLSSEASITINVFNNIVSAFQIPSYAISPSKIASGEEVTFNFALKNISSSAITLDSLGVAVRYGANRVRNFPVVTNVTINPNETYSYSQKRSFTQIGNYRWWLYFYYQGVGYKITKDRYFYVYPVTSKLRVSSFYFSPSYPRKWQRTWGYFTLKNDLSYPVTLNSTGIATRYYTRYYTYKLNFPYFTNLTLNPGQAKTFSSSRKFGYVGTYKTWVYFYFQNQGYVALYLSSGSPAIKYLKVGY